MSVRSAIDSLSDSVVCNKASIWRSQLLFFEEAIRQAAKIENRAARYSIFHLELKELYPFLLEIAEQQSEEQPHAQALCDRFRELAAECEHYAS